MNALIITYEGYKDYEAIYPYYRLLEEGFEVSVISNSNDKVKGILGCCIPSTHKLECLSDKSNYDYMLNNNKILIIPGGVNSLEKLRMVKPAVNFVKDWVESGKTTGTMCSGAQMLISAKVVKGKNISAYYSMQDDVINAGAYFIDLPVVVDGNIITSPHYKWVGNWMKEIINHESKNKIRSNV